jgi:hypothetical protein
MSFSIFKSFAFGTFLVELSAQSVAFSPSSSYTLQVQGQRLNLKLAHRKGSQIDVKKTVVSSPLSTTNLIAAPNGVQADADEFDWFKAWYPVFPVDILDREKPTPLELLGMKLVVYNDGAVVNKEGTPIGFGSKLARPRNARREEGTWRAFADVCPHRK